MGLFKFAQMILGMSFKGHNSLVDNLNIEASTGLHHSHKLVSNETTMDYPHPRIERLRMKILNTRQTAHSTQGHTS